MVMTVIKEAVEKAVENVAEKAMEVAVAEVEEKPKRGRKPKKKEDE